MDGGGETMGAGQNQAARWSGSRSNAVRKMCLLCIAQFVEWVMGQTASGRFKSALGQHCSKWAGPVYLFPIKQFLSKYSTDQTLKIRNTNFPMSKNF
jgi:hypothetical protein